MPFSPWNVIRHSGNQNILLHVTSRTSIGGPTCFCKGHVNVGDKDLWEDNCDSWLCLSVFWNDVHWWHNGLTWYIHGPFPGKVRWRITSLFSGIECFREALCILDSAVAEKFGFCLDISYSLMVAWPRFRLDLSIPWCYLGQHDVDSINITHVLWR